MTGIINKLFTCIDEYVTHIYNFFMIIIWAHIMIFVKIIKCIRDSLKILSSTSLEIIKNTNDNYNYHTTEKTPVISDSNEKTCTLSSQLVIHDVPVVVKDEQRIIEEIKDSSDVKDVFKINGCMDNDALTSLYVGAISHKTLISGTELAALHENNLTHDKDSDAFPKLTSDITKDTGLRDCEIPHMNTIGQDTKIPKMTDYHGKKTLCNLDDIERKFTDLQKNYEMNKF